MRRLFRLVGLLRFLIGAAIVAAGLWLRGDVGEIWTVVMVLVGAGIAVSGFTSALLLIAYYGVFPFLLIGVLWLLKDFWNGSYYSDTLERSYGYLYFYWAIGLVLLPLQYYHYNSSWFFMVRHFAVDEPPTDTPHQELIAVGVVDFTGSQYFAAATITEQGLILDRRNFKPVVLPWRWVESVKPDETVRDPARAAVISMRNDNDEFLTFSVPWNRDLLELTPGDLKRR